MSNEFWFKPKTFGYGATPATWQGWSVMAVYAAVIAGCVAVNLHTHSLAVRVGSLVAIVAATIVLVAVSVQKTDGAWGWNAGRANQNAGKNH
jgi:acyl-CoA synthetase (AMP-forming)/AMP-acid ligase II